MKPNRVIQLVLCKVSYASGFQSHFGPARGPRREDSQSYPTDEEQREGSKGLGIIGRNLLYRALVCLLCCLGLSACHSSKSSDGQNSCNSTGEVKDFTGLDGCQLMIVMEDGKKLLPGSILVDDVNLAAGQKIRFDYRPIEMMSVCMAEDLIVEITCLEVIE